LEAELSSRRKEASNFEIRRRMEKKNFSKKKVTLCHLSTWAGSVEGGLTKACGHLETQCRETTTLQQCS